MERPRFLHLPKLDKVARVGMAAGLAIAPFGCGGNDAPTSTEIESIVNAPNAVYVNMEQDTILGADEVPRVEEPLTDEFKKLDGAFAQDDGSTKLSDNPTKYTSQIFRRNNDALICDVVTAPPGTKGIRVLGGPNTNDTTEVHVNGGSGEVLICFDGSLTSFETEVALWPDNASR